MRPAAIPMLLSTLLLARMAGGQDSVRVLRGRILDSADSLPIANVNIEIVDAHTRQRTDVNGRFLFRGFADDDIALRARRPGLVPKELNVTVPAGHWREVTLYMTRLPTMLTTVRINGQQLKVPARFVDVYARAARGWGHFFTREQIEREQVWDVVSLLYRVPGVTPAKDGVTFARCNTEANLWGQGAQAKVAVYVDGVRRTRRANPEEDEVAMALREVPISAIQAVEVYRGVAEIPGEFLDDACAVILIWTKSY
jgi:hypothetical protein